LDVKYGDIESHQIKNQIITFSSDDYEIDRDLLREKVNELNPPLTRTQQNLVDLMLKSKEFWEIARIMEITTERTSNIWREVKIRLEELKHNHN
jgi:DNA-binding CsgD family transcriptional regulator